MREPRLGVRFGGPLGMWLLGAQAGLDGNRGEGWTSPGSRLEPPRAPALTSGWRGAKGISWTLHGDGGEATAATGRDDEGSRRRRLHVRWRHLELGHEESRGARKWTVALGGVLGALPLRLEGDLGEGEGSARLGCGGGRHPAGLRCEWSVARARPLQWRAAAGLRVARGALAGSRFDVLAGRAARARSHWRWRWGRWSFAGTAEWRRTAAGRRASTTSVWMRVPLGRHLDARLTVARVRGADGVCGVGALVGLRGRGKKWRWEMEVESPPRRARREALRISGPVGGQRVALRVARGAHQVTLEFEWCFFLDLVS